ncbi:MAG TPA: TRAP transporter small permease [Propionibacterium sp.]|nr:TRAP transporter small permease [Propionibacterium sp.]
MRALRMGARWISMVLGVLATSATVAVMVLTAWQVVVRLLTGRFTPGLLEISESALVVAVFLGLAYASWTSAHIDVDLVTSRFSEKTNRRLTPAIGLVTLAYLVAWIYATGDRAAQSLAQGEARMGVFQWPLWPARWAIVIGLVGMALVVLAQIIDPKARAAGSDEVIEGVHVGAPGEIHGKDLPHE